MSYADTRALVKRQLEEPFSNVFEALFRRGDTMTSQLGVIEMHCALARRRRLCHRRQGPAEAAARRGCTVYRFY